MNIDGTTHKRFDVLVVGGGHAGIEAALASARMGCRTCLLTQDRREIGRMPCNPAIGGLGKGQLVREVDALGGQMGLAIDATGIQFRLLNRRKGPAVRSPRAQADKHAYQAYMQGAVERQAGLTIVEGEARELVVAGAGHSDARARGVRTAAGEEIAADHVIVSTGTFLRGLMHVGADQRTGGREGAASAEGLSGSLTTLGLTLRRLKTGTPMRLRRDSIDFDALARQDGDEDPLPFSFRTQSFAPVQIACHMTWTNERTHEVIRDNLHRSPLYAGAIEGRGPRYCPSVEDKVVRFASKERHQIFLEPEGRSSDEIYVNGLSTSLPADVQVAMVRTIAGLEAAEIVRFGYAVEYDALPSWQVGPTLESKRIHGLFFAGQVLGTSGYEEAAAQGLIAGANAALCCLNQPPLIIARNEAYVGVLVDDLSTKEIVEPYRMFTSRVERRLATRCDNAEGRLLIHARRLGLLSAEDLRQAQHRRTAVSKLRCTVNSLVVPDPMGGARIPARDLVRRPEVCLLDLLTSQGDADGGPTAADADAGSPQWRLAVEEVEAELKYGGYIIKQDKSLAQMAELDSLALPVDMPYLTTKALSFEAREKLDRMRPATLGQAARIDGVRSADLAVLAVLLRRSRSDRLTGGDRPVEGPVS